MLALVTNWGRVIVSILVVVGFMAVTLMYMTQKLNGNPVPEILSILLGALATNFTSVVSYWIGSSASSNAKDLMIQNMAKDAGMTTTERASQAPEEKADRIPS